MRISSLQRPLAYLLLIIVLLGTLSPFLWSLFSSFKTTGDIFAGSFLPRQWTVEQYTRLLKQTLFSRWLLNSTLVAIVSTLIGLFTCALAGYAFAKYDFAGKGLLFWLIVGSLTIPPFTTLIPLFGWMAKLGLINSYWALILPFSVSPLGIFLMRQYILSIPNDLIDAGRIDGADDLNVFVRIVLPLTRPALAAVGITIFLNSWNSYVFPLVLMRTPEMQAFPVGLASLNTVYFVEYGMLMAAAMLSSLPMLIVFVLMQREFIAGLTQGAVKA